MVTLNGKTYEAADFLNGGHIAEIVAGTGESLPRFLAVFADALADLGRARQTTSSDSQNGGQTGTLIFELDNDVAFAVGSVVTIARTSDPDGVRYTALVEDYVSATKLLTVSVLTSEGAGGPYTDWTIAVAGERGETGPVRERNRVINGTFAVSDRPAGTTDNTYCVDRWRLLLEAANAATFAVDTADVPDGAKYAAKLTVGSANNNKFGLFQHVIGKNMWDLRGQVGSLRVPLKATSGIGNVRAAVIQFTGTEDAVSGDPISSWGADGTNPTLAANWSYANTPASLGVTTGWADYLIENVSISASAKNIGFLIWNDDKTTTTTTDILRIGGKVAFHPGASAPTYSPPSYEEELAECLRYCQKLGGFTNFMLSGAAHANSTTSAQIILSFPKMVKTPTLSASSASAVTVNSGAAVAAGTANSFSNPSDRSALLTVTTSGLTAGNGAIAYIPSSSDYILADAE